MQIVTVKSGVDNGSEIWITLHNQLTINPTNIRKAKLRPTVSNAVSILFSEFSLRILNAKIPGIKEILMNPRICLAMGISSPIVIKDRIIVA